MSSSCEGKETAHHGKGVALSCQVHNDEYWKVDGGTPLVLHTGVRSIKSVFKAFSGPRGSSVNTDEPKLQANLKQQKWMWVKVFTSSLPDL